MKIANVRLETVGWSHLDGEKVMVVLLEFLVGGILNKKQLPEASEIVDETRWKGVEPIGGCPFQTERKSDTRWSCF